MIRRYLTNAQWERIEKLCPGKEGDKGRHGEDNRRFVDGVLWILRTGAPWRDLPDEFGNWNSQFQRFRRWAKKGVWERIFNELQDGLRVPHHRCHCRPRTPACSGRKKGALMTRRSGVRAAVPAPRSTPWSMRWAIRCASLLTGGQVHDSKQLEALIEGFDFEKLLADKGYDNNRIRAVIDLKGAEAVIPSLSSRSQAIPYDKDTYKERNLVERFFCLIKRFRRIATRYEKTAVSFAGMLCLAGAMAWLR